MSKGYDIDELLRKTPLSKKEIKKVMSDWASLKIQIYKQELIEKLGELQNKKVKAQSYEEAAGVYYSIQLIKETT